MNAALACRILDALLTLYGRLAIPTAETQTCSNGVIGVEGAGQCCPVACGTCGGMGCKMRALDVGLTADDCCTRRIEATGASCDESKTAPCMIGSGESDSEFLSEIRYRTLPSASEFI